MSVSACTCRNCHEQLQQHCDVVCAAPICDGPYEIFEDVYAMNGNPYNEVAMATLEQCKAACAGSSLCVAFDYSQARTPYCWRHLTADNLREENVAALVANDHYRFNDACGDRRERLSDRLSI